MGYAGTPEELEAERGRLAAAIDRTRPAAPRTRTYDFNGRVWLPRTILTYVTAKPAPPAIPGTEERKARLEAALEITRAGFAGVMPNGNIVDRREYPHAIPIQANPLLGCPEPAALP